MSNKISLEYKIVIPVGGKIDFMVRAVDGGRFSNHYNGNLDVFFGIPDYLELFGDFREKIESAQPRSELFYHTVGDELVEGKYK
jgi:hypothetical protein